MPLTGTDLQHDIRRVHDERLQASAAAIARELDCNPTYVREVLAGGSTEYYRKECREDLTPLERLILVADELYPCAPRADIAELVGCSAGFVSRTILANGHLRPADSFEPGDFAQI